MQNQFDTDNYPTTEPGELVSGTRWAWKKPDITSVYPTALYSLRYRLSLQESAGTAFEFDALKTDGSHVVEIESFSTEEYTAGHYVWRSFIVRDSDASEVFISEGVIDVRPSLESGADARSHTLRVLQAIRSTIEGTASEDQLRIEIAGRVIERRSVSELMDLEREYNKRWMREKREYDRKAGKTAPRRVLIGMRA